MNPMLFILRSRYFYYSVSGFGFAFIRRLLPIFFSF